MTILTGWENFYVIVGSSAGALIGLQFVVMTLLADRPNRPGLALAGSAFATPTIGLFRICTPVISDHQRSLANGQQRPHNSLAATGRHRNNLRSYRGLAYASTNRIYKPVFEDWLFHALLPLGRVRNNLTGPACAAYAHAHGAMFGMGVAALLLLFIGIHNAWDLVTFHVYSKKRPKDEPAP